MKTLTYPSYGIAASAAAAAIKREPNLTVKIDKIAIGYALTLHRAKPMKARSMRIKLPRLDWDASKGVSDEI